MKLNSRRIIAKIVIIALPVLVFIVVAIRSSRSHHYLDLCLNFISEKYHDVSELVLLDFLVYFGFLGVFAIYTGWDKSSLKRLVVKPSRSAVHDLVILMLRSTYIIEILVYLLTFGIAKRLSGHIPDFWVLDGSWIPSIDNMFIQQIIFLFIVDFAFYWMHRIEHTIPFLWAFHKFHHSATEMNVITSKRVHPFESEIMIAIFFALPFALFGIPLYSLILVRILLKLHGAITHSGLDWNWGWFGKYILLSPKYHSIHHSTASQHQNKNYANHFPILDHIFGTYYSGDVDHITYGVTDDNINNKNLLGALWAGVTESLGALTDLIAGGNEPASDIHDDSIKTEPD